MKTAISLSDETFARATERAIQLGMSRSEFFARAAESYLAQLDAKGLTQRIDRALGRIDTDDSTTDAVSLGRRRVAQGDDW